MVVHRDRLAATVRKGAGLLIDTPVLIAYLEGGQEITEAATLVIDDWIHGGRNHAFVSTISVMELLVGPLRAAQGIDEYLDFLLRFPNVDCVPVDVAAVEQAALVRARYRVKSPDALIIGTAVTVGAEVIVTNDGSWGGISPKPVVCLSDYV